MATIEIVATRRLGIERSEFHLACSEGEPLAKEIFRFTERGTVWEYVILETHSEGDKTVALCLGWVPADNAFVGIRTTTKPINKTERKRWNKTLPADF